MSRFQKPLAVCLGIGLMAGHALADSAPAPRAQTTSRIADVKLTSESSLAGRYIDGEGRPVDGAIVTLIQNRTIVARTTTDTEGGYQFHQVDQGVYQVVLGSQSQTVRVWNAALAPPASRAVVTTVRADRIVRGQFGLVAGSVGSTIGAVGGVTGVAAGGYSITQSMDAQDEADAAVQEAAELREMLNVLMSP